MNQHFDQLSFKYPWRDYQKRVLNELSGHLNDDHLHVVAAPGAGKTILGLEVMRSLGQPTLIIAPTLTIRDQWIDRLLNMFMDEAASLPWISKSLHKPEYLTVVTYQALHATFTGEPEETLDGEEEDEEEVAKPTKNRGDVLIARLKDVGLKTLVLDEAHHLRHEWWKHLTELKKGVDSLTVVSLTATPPFDVDYREWQRYEALCGPIDAEISVPELVKCENLCPHQDYVYYSEPTRHEMKLLSEYNRGVWNFLNQLKESNDFGSMLESHQWVVGPDEHTEAILKEPKLYSAILIALHACGRPVPKKALELLGVSLDVIPPLDREWYELLLNAILYTHEEHFQSYEEIIQQWRLDLRRVGAIERRRVRICDTKMVQKLLANSLAKLNSIVDIVEKESESLGSNLRLVVLADYIRADQMPKEVSDDQAMEKIGVVPAFEFLRKRHIETVRLGILTGSLVIIPANVADSLRNELEKLGAAREGLVEEVLPHDSNYVQIRIRGASRSLMVNVMTRLFSLGEITVLVGTQALLGEGWDAPTLNTLIIASNVGSYMLSNQMRGRAIRVDPDRPEKVANVWHLVGVDTHFISDALKKDQQEEGQQKLSDVDPFDEVPTDIGYDFERMRRRFRAFEGVSYSEPHVIENGFRRLNLSRARWTSQGIRKTNAATLSKAMQRDQLKAAWEVALTGKCPRPEMHERVETREVPGIFIFSNTLKHLIINAVLGGLSVLAYVLQHMHPEFPGRHKLVILFIGLCAGLCYTIPKLLKVLYLWFRNGTIEKQIKQVGLAVVDSLRLIELIKTSPRLIRVVSGAGEKGLVYAYLEGGTIEERRYFNESMEMLLNPVDNPRYLLVRQTKNSGVVSKDYHAIPTVIAAKKESAEQFASCWRRYVGSAYCVYTRTGEGRLALLKARAQSLAASFQNKAERKSVWE